MGIATWLRLMALVGLALACDSARAAEISPREKMLEIAQNLNSPYRIEQMQAISDMGKLTDKAVVDDFKIQDRLMAYVRNRMAGTDMRREAMEALLQLSRKELLSVNPLDELRRLIADKKDALESRLDAVDMIARMGAGKDEGVAAKEARKKAQDALAEIATGGANEEALRAAAFQALSAFPGTRELLLKGISDQSPRLRAAALAGLARNIALTGTADARLAYQVVAAVTKSQATRDEQVAGIDCITAIVRTGTKLNDEAAIKFLLSTFATSQDDELVERVAVCLLYTGPDQAFAVARAFLNALTKPGTPRSPKVQLAILMGLNNLVNTIATQMPDADATKAAAAIKEISAFMGKILLLDNIDPHLLDIAIKSLGGIPNTFSREEAVAGLIAALTKYPSKADLIEKILMQYKRGAPLRDIDDKPDVAQWTTWFENNKARLKPGTAPYL